MKVLNDRMRLGLHTSAILTLLIVSALGACNRSRSSLIVRVGMSFGEVADKMKQAGARREDSINPGAWATPDSPNAARGWHIGYLLSDNTCVMVQVQSEPSPSNNERDFPVRGFEIGLPGKGYEGKMEWSQNSDQGWHKSPKEFDVSDPHHSYGGLDFDDPPK